MPPAHARPLVLLLALAFSSTASAEQRAVSPFAPGGPLAPFPATRPPLDMPQPRRYTPFTAAWLELHFGLGTPLGLTGAALDLQPVPWLAINAGAGGSYRGDRQVAVTPRLRYPWGKGPMAFGFGAGYSFGAYERTNATWSAGGGEGGGWYWKTWDKAEWFNLELSVERRLAPVGWRVYVGRAVLKSPSPSSCVVNSPPQQPTTCEVSSEAQLWYAGFAYAFGAGW